MAEEQRFYVTRLYTIRPGASRPTYQYDVIDRQSNARRGRYRTRKQADRHAEILNAKEREQTA